jgi:hypothetical protein
MDYTLRMISYIADIGDIVVLMARRGVESPTGEEPGSRSSGLTRMCCHVFESPDVSTLLLLVSFNGRLGL